MYFGEGCGDQTRCVIVTSVRAMSRCQDGAEGGGGELAGGLPLHRPPLPPLQHLPPAGARHGGTLLPAPGKLSLLSLTTGSCWLQEIVDWVYNIIVGNLSNTVFINRGYDKMEQMALVTHLQSLNVTTWEEIRNSRATFG